MEENSINIPDSVMEQLQCSQCKEYLSCGPVRLLPNGTGICGQCSPPNSDAVVYRELILEETILKNVVFPCRFKTNGCRNNVAFGQAVEHESKCVYQSYHCPLPVSNDETCCWSGLRSELFDHLAKNHPSCLVEAASFIIQVDQNSQRIFVVLNDDLVFLVTYLYLANTCSLNYDVRYINRDWAVSASYKIKIENKIPDCYVSLKEKSCPIFDNCFNVLNNTLNLKNYMETLDNPNSIKINIIVKDTKRKMLGLESVKASLTVDYEKLASLRCLCCRIEYLVFPIFDVQGQVVCFKCAYKNHCNPLASADLKLQERIAETNFPCRWLSCNFIGTGDVIRTHEINCQFRDYKCPICLTLIATTFAAKHLQSHDALVSEGALTLKETDDYPKYVFIIEDNKVIIVKLNKITQKNRKSSSTPYVLYCSDTFIGDLLLGTFEDEEVIVQFEYCGRKWTESTLSKVTPGINYTEIFQCDKEVSVKLRSCKSNLDFLNYLC